MQSLSRRWFLQAAAAAGLPQLRGAAGGGHPNLLFIIADQHSGLALGAAGHPIVRTPRLDALARQGVFFTHAFTAGATCTPSRASLDTGLHVQVHGVVRNGIPLRRDIPSIFTVLNEAGYRAPSAHVEEADRAAYFKWLKPFGYGEVASPIIGPADKARLIPTPYRFAVGQAGVRKEHSIDAFSVQSAIQYLEQRKGDGRPFGLFVPLHGAHDPYVVPAPYDSMYPASGVPLPPYKQGEYDHKPPRQKRTWQAQGADKLSDEQIRILVAHYLGMVSQTDMLVGQLLDKLSALGLDKNTIVVYVADHGDTMGYHRMFTKGFGFYEPAVRIPLIIRTPQELPRGVRVDSLVSGVDVFPTLVELLGLPPVKGVQGRSLVPAWRGRERTVHHEVFGGQGDEKRDRMLMIRTDQWKFTRYDEGGRELYDLQKDPAELNNLAASPDHAGVAREMSKRMDDWIQACKNRRQSGTRTRADALKVTLCRDRWRA